MNHLVNFRNISEEKVRIREYTRPGVSFGRKFKVDISTPQRKIRNHFKISLSFQKCLLDPLGSGNLNFFKNNIF